MYLFLILTLSFSLIETSLQSSFHILKNDEGRIFGGRNAKNGEFPFMAFLYLDGYICGGFLVSKTVIITAAHCVFDDENQAFLSPQDIRIKVGDVQMGKGTTMKVKAIYPHPNYKYENYRVNDDIAILQLSSEVTIGDNIKTICLTKVDHQVADRTPVLQMGWGEYENESDPSNILRVAATGYILHPPSCMKEMRRNPPDGFICVSNKCGERICEGDSGGPLVIEENKKKIAIGTLSYSFCKSCTFENKTPTMFTDIRVYAKWISDTIKDKTICWV